MKHSLLKSKALDYHAYPQPGKIATALTKPANTAEDLSLAYSPGVAEPCHEIANDPLAVYQYTQKGNLVAVISNGTAVLGLGNIGPLASKPVMEGKVFLFKKFADVDGFDIEIDEHNKDKLVDIISALAPTFGGINLEDIAAPDCFYIEQALKARLSIPVFHDDQHGTAITVSAALKNALYLQKKQLKDVKIVCVGAGAAGLATLDMLSSYGASRDKIFLFDSQGLVTTLRENLGYKEPYAQQGPSLSLASVMKGADVFIGLSVGNLLSEEMVLNMAEKAIIFAMANPTPEVNPDLVRYWRPDVIVATGRSDYPNQVNNVLCFPYIFRGAFDVRASTINTAMKHAAVEALATLARQPVPKEIQDLYHQDLIFGHDYILPKPQDPRLKRVVSTAVSAAAVKTGVATAYQNSAVSIEEYA